MNFKADAAHIRNITEETITTPFEYTKEQTAIGTARPSFVASQLNRKDATRPSERTLIWAAVNLYAAGTDTTSNPILFFFLFMALYPKVQSKARAELDAVLGAENRLPILSDRERLPYVRALLKDVLRMSAVSLLSVPHMVREDNIHSGYFIPKHSVIITNSWYMRHDPRRYVQPDQFEPNHFLAENPELDPSVYIFGHGRQRCPGELMADDMLFLTCARVLAAVRISSAMDMNGAEIAHNSDYVGLPLLRPIPFTCEIKVCSPKTEALLQIDLD